MERLTYKLPDGRMATSSIIAMYEEREPIKDLPAGGQNVRYYITGEIVQRLSEYEDTNLAPDEVKRVFDAYARTFGKGVSFDRIQELIKAEREGRVLVTPPAAKKPTAPAGQYSEETLRALERMGDKVHSGRYDRGI